MASNTPNLDLLKKDPVTDGSETFNIETMLNENWDKIDSAMGQVREELADINIPLSDVTNGTRSDVAASEKAVGQVMSVAQAAQTTANAANTAAAAAKARADSAFQLGNERKQEVVDVLIAKGISASTSESWDSLIAKMASIIKATGNAGAGDVLSGKTFSNQTGNNRTGTMANQGAQIITPGTANKAIPAGYHNGSGYVLGDADLIAANIKAGIVFGILGTLEPKQYYNARLPNIDKRSFQQITIPFTPAILMAYVTSNSNFNDNTQRFGWIFAARINFTGTAYPIKTFYARDYSGPEDMQLYLFKAAELGNAFRIEDELVSTLFLYNQRLSPVYNVTVMAWA